MRDDADALPLPLDLDDHRLQALDDVQVALAARVPEKITGGTAYERFWVWSRCRVLCQVPAVSTVPPACVRLGVPNDGPFQCFSPFRDASREAMAEFNLARSAMPQRAFTVIVRGD